MKETCLVPVANQMAQKATHFDWRWAKWISPSVTLTRCKTRGSLPQWMLSNEPIATVHGRYVTLHGRYVARPSLLRCFGQNLLPERATLYRHPQERLEKNKYGRKTKVSVEIRKTARKKGKRKRRSRRRRKGRKRKRKKDEANEEEDEDKDKEGKERIIKYARMEG